MQFSISCLHLKILFLIVPPLTEGVGKACVYIFKFSQYSETFNHCCQILGIPWFVERVKKTPFKLFILLSISSNNCSVLKFKSKTYCAFNLLSRLSSLNPTVNNS